MVSTNEHASGQDPAREWHPLYLGKASADEQAILQHALQLTQQYYPANAKTPMGEPLLENLFGAAQMVAEMNLLPEAVAATLLADLPEYREDWPAIVTEQCGQTVANIVKGLHEVQKLTRFAAIDQLGTPEERAEQAESMRKMLLAMVSDIRVVLIKLALRTRTMQFMSNVADSPEKRSLAKETLDIFAPLANRLGVWQLKWQLEDLGFRHQYPEEYRRIAKLLDEKRIERLEYIENFLQTLRDELGKYNIHYDVAGRPKHIYSIYKKMVKKKLDFDGLYDIRAVRYGSRFPANLTTISPTRKPTATKACTRLSSARKTKAWKCRSVRSICITTMNSAWQRTGVTKKAATATAPTNKKSLGCVSCWIGAKIWAKVGAKIWPMRSKPSCSKTLFMC